MFPSIVTSYNKRVLKTFNFFDKTYDKMVNQQGTLCLKKVSNIQSSNLPLTYFCFLEKFT